MIIRKSTTVCVLVLAKIVFCQDFGYEGSEGPNHWGDKYSKCLGKHQSPIDIEEDNIKVVEYPPLTFEHFNETLPAVKLKNNGHTAILSILEGKLPKVYGGPLNGTYVFSQLHFHWGNNDTEGSENTIKHHRFPMELHMVFYKEDYGDFETALNNDDGLSVLSFLYSVNNRKPFNKNYVHFINGLNNIHEADMSTKMEEFVPLEKFSLKNPQYYFTYEGSLTTPPCSEVVIWIEFVTTIPLSSNQTKMFRLLNDNKHTNLRHNFRPVQPIYDRVIYLNAKKSGGISTKFNNIWHKLLLMPLVIISLFFMKITELSKS